MTLNINSQELFADLIGQYSASELLKAALKKKHLAPAYLFHGPDGVGRRLAALRFLEGVLNQGNSSKKERRRLKEFNHPDLHWVEPTYLNQGQLVPKSIAEQEGIVKRNPPQIRLEQIRKVARFLSQEPIESSLGMVVIESAERMGEGPSNALLKTLEEPGKGLLILISDRPERLPSTIRSRCQHIPFRRLHRDVLQKILLNNKDSDTQKNEPSLNFDQQNLINLAGGSPGAFMKHLNMWNEIPEEVWPRLTKMNRDPIESLSLAKELTETLDGEQQIWLIDWIEQYLWKETLNSKLLKRLEKLRSQLLCFVQPRLAWEVALLEIDLILKR